MKLHTIAFVKPLDVGQLHIFFDDERDGPIIDIAPLLAQGGVFDAVRQRFAAVEKASDGRSIFWRIGDGEDDIVDLCADALWLMAHPEDGAAVTATPTEPRAY